MFVDFLKEDHLNELNECFSDAFKKVVDKSVFKTIGDFFSSKGFSVQNAEFKELGLDKIWSLYKNHIKKKEVNTGARFIVIARKKMDMHIDRLKSGDFDPVLMRDGTQVGWVFVFDRLDGSFWRFDSIVNHSYGKGMKIVSSKLVPVKSAVDSSDTETTLRYILDIGERSFCAFALDTTADNLKEKRKQEAKSISDALAPVDSRTNKSQIMLDHENELAQRSGADMAEKLHDKFIDAVKEAKTAIDGTLNDLVSTGKRVKAKINQDKCKKLANKIAELQYLLRYISEGYKEEILSFDAGNMYARENAKRLNIAIKDIKSKLSSLK